MAIDDFDDDFSKAPAKRPKAPSVPDGDYDVEITAAAFRETSSGDVFSWKLAVIGGEYDGRTVERAIFFETKKGSEEEQRDFKKKKIQELKADLKTIGFDVELWTKENKRPFSAQLTPACNVMVGVRLKVRVKASGEFVNVYINKRLADTDGKPLVFGEKEMLSLANADFGNSGIGDAPAQDTNGQAPAGGEVPW